MMQMSSNSRETELEVGSGQPNFRFLCVIIESAYLLIVGV